MGVKPMRLITDDAEMRCVASSSAMTTLYGICLVRHMPCSSAFLIERHDDNQAILK